MSDESKSPLLQILDAIAEAEHAELVRRFGPPKTIAEICAELNKETPKPKRRRVDFHGLTVIDGGRKD